jgi:hypothetical protein
LYTNGLYFNADEVAFEKRLKSNSQIIKHSVQLRKMIEASKKFIPSAFHFIPIDYIILNSPKYLELFSFLKKKEAEDDEFKKHIKHDIYGREYTEANINFILEELVVGHLLREHLVELPRTLVKNDDWRLISYPGNFMHSEVYCYQKNYLEKNKKTENLYRNVAFDFTSKSLSVFDQINLEE